MKKVILVLTVIVFSLTVYVYGSSYPPECGPGAEHFLCPTGFHCVLPQGICVPQGYYYKTIEQCPNGWQNVTRCVYNYQRERCYPEEQEFCVP